MLLGAASPAAAPTAASPLTQGAPRSPGSWFPTELPPQRVTVKQHTPTEGTPSSPGTVLSRGWLTFHSRLEVLAGPALLLRSPLPHCGHRPLPPPCHVSHIGPFLPLQPHTCSFLPSSCALQTGTLILFAAYNEPSSPRPLSFTPAKPRGQDGPLLNDPVVPVYPVLICGQSSQGMVVPGTL